MSDLDDILQPDVLALPYNQSRNVIPQSILKNRSNCQLNFNEGKNLLINLKF